MQSNERYSLFSGGKFYFQMESEKNFKQWIFLIFWDSDYFKQSLFKDHMKALNVIKSTNSLALQKSSKLFAKSNFHDCFFSPKRIKITPILESWNRVYVLLNPQQLFENGWWRREPSSWKAPGKFPQYQNLDPKIFHCSF